MTVVNFKDVQEDNEVVFNENNIETTFFIEEEQIGEEVEYK